MGRKPGQQQQPPRTRLEEIRRHRGLTSAELARRVGIDPTQLYRMEANKRGLSPKWRKRIARELAVRLDQLFAPIGDPIAFSDARPPEVEFRPYESSHEPQAIGTRLKAVLQYIGLTAAELPLQIGGTEADVFDWLAGRIRPPILLMNRLAARAGVTLTWIYYGDEEGMLPGIAARLKALLPPE